MFSSEQADFYFKGHALPLITYILLSRDMQELFRATALYLLVILIAKAAKASNT
jgi:hypothetical protein